MLSNLLMIVSAVILITLFLRYFIKRNNDIRRDTRKWLTPNATNYNLESMDSEAIEKMSAEEVKEAIRKAKQSEMTSLSPKDFYALKRKVEKG